MFSKLPTIAYIAQSFPNLTATFIYREVFALRRMGFHVVTLSVRKPAIDKLSAEAKSLVDSTRYVIPFAWPAFITAHLYFLITHPIRYISTLLLVLTRPGEKPQNRLRTFLHFGGAIYLALEAKKQKVQHIHAHFSVNAASSALVISRMLGITFSFTAHNNFFTDQIILREKLKAAKFIVAISEYSRDFLLDLLPNENLKEKFHIVHCGVSTDDFSPPAHKASDQLPLVFSVAQLTERKGIPVLVEACRIVAERGYDFKCIIAGDGLQRPLLEQQVAQYQLQDKVQLVGVVFQEHLASYLNEADMFVLPCLTAPNGDVDGIPVVLMEAMAMEIPTVSTYVSGIPELIEDGHSGLLVKEKDAEALADALQRLLEDDELRTRLGKNGRQKVIEEFNIDRSAAQLATLFERYLTNGQ